MKSYYLSLSIHRFTFGEHPCATAKLALIVIADSISGGLPGGAPGGVRISPRLRIAEGWETAPSPRDCGRLRPFQFAGEALAR
jgi:hypothetical protein